MRIKPAIKLVAVAVSAVLGASAPAWATNGMNMEGYGPIATAMGGASMAYDNGTAALANNPATLGLMENGSRLDLAIGNLRPDISTTMTAMPGQPKADSRGTSYFMPAFGWVKKQDQWNYGFGVFGQGGMGTDYKGDTWPAAGTGEEVGTELSVGRAILPFAFSPNDRFTLGGSVDYVWAGMDLNLAMPIAHPQYGAVPGTFADFSPAFGGKQVMGSASFSPSLGRALGGMAANGASAVRFDFSNSNDFTGEASGDGVSGKLGFTVKASPTVTVGGVYHFETNLSDWTTSNASFSGWAGNSKMGELTGKVRVKDFNWPSMAGLGIAVQASDQLLLVADIKQINWGDTMESFNMDFIADGNNARFGVAAGDSASISMTQEWDNQTVLNLGAAYDLNDKWVIRGGVNLSSNPVPDEYVNPLFPAIIENHFTAGFGVKAGPGDLNFSLAYAPEVTQTNSYTGAEISHSQLNWQLMYSWYF